MWTNFDMMPPQVRYVLAARNNHPVYMPENQLVGNRVYAGGKEHLRGGPFSTFGMHVRKRSNRDSIPGTIAVGLHDQLAPPEMQIIIGCPAVLYCITLDALLQPRRDHLPRLALEGLVCFSAMQSNTVMAVHEIREISLQDTEEVVLLCGAGWILEVSPRLRANGPAETTTA
ncbi:hypothetical protein MMC19_006552 [Ptychographa xylographoides]|nr:hypothetical protein [Ptychographa xylographoides]